MDNHAPIGSLAPYAVPLSGRRGRVHAEPEDPTRNPFQRDRDRIIHCHAFRRLQGKTQVFEAGESDHVRTRLTHTLEVAQIGRDMARRLGLNEDLVECLALAHDLGHPPFGHSGEEVLDLWMRERGGHFEHNEQSIRIVTVLERRSLRHPGLNVNREIIEGLAKHSGLSFPDGTTRMHAMEAQLVNICDEIAYISHDCDDGIRAGVFSVDDLRGVPLAERAAARARERGSLLRSSLIHLLTDDLHRETGRRLAAFAIDTLDAVERAPEPVVDFSDAMRGTIMPLRTFLAEKLYAHPSVAGSKEEGKILIRELCMRYEKNPPAKILDLQARTGSELPEAIKDYIAGMTDAFARAQAAGR